MKQFFPLYVMVLILLEVFLFFGGYALFDFSRRFFLAGASTAFVITIILFAFNAQLKKIEELEKRIQILENDKEN